TRVSGQRVRRCADGVPRTLHACCPRASTQIATFQAPRASSKLVHGAACAEKAAVRKASARVRHNNSSNSISIIINDTPPGNNPANIPVREWIRRLCARSAGRTRKSHPSSSSSNNNNSSTHNMMPGEVRVAVIGCETATDEARQSPYTIYRTVVTYRGECYQRTLRYRQFRGFYRQLRSSCRNAVKAPFPAAKWTRKASLSPEVVEERRVMLDEFMKSVCGKELPPAAFEQLLQLLQVGKFGDSRDSLTKVHEARKTVDVVDDDISKRSNFTWKESEPALPPHTTSTWMTADDAPESMGAPISCVYTSMTSSMASVEVDSSVDHSRVTIDGSTNEVLPQLDESEVNGSVPASVSRKHVGFNLHDDDESATAPRVLPPMKSQRSDDEDSDLEPFSPHFKYLGEINHLLSSIHTTLSESESELDEKEQQLMSSRAQANGTATA
ncbi:TPA: hypothetical protein N0F65_011729, partial [Lagenidium giganteum]